jgi:hypothetical protein
MGIDAPAPKKTEMGTEHFSTIWFIISSFDIAFSEI